MDAIEFRNPLGVTEKKLQYNLKLHMELFSCFTCLLFLVLL